MKKLIPALLLAALVAGTAAAQVPEGRPVFSVSGGLLYDSEEPGLAQWGLHLGVGFRLGRHFMITPEAMFAGSAGHSLFYPGLILNYLGRQWFAGAGLVQPVLMLGQGDTSLAAKFVLGHASRTFVISGFFMGSLKTDPDRSLFEHYRIGVTFGFRF